MRRLDVHLYEGDGFNTAMKAIAASDPIDVMVVPLEQRDRRMISIIVRDGNGQSLMDNLQSCLEPHKDWRIMSTQLEASIPTPPDPKDKSARREKQATREEIYADIEKGARLDRDFAIFVVLSTVVAAIGLNSDGVAAVIGAMVIAPLLGPILGFAFAVALGDQKLMRHSGLTLGAGIILALLASLLLSLVLPINLESRELLSRAEVRLDGVALAMAAGGAAALSITKGTASALVGVMVAAALLPPAASVGLFAGAQEWGMAWRAALLLLLNVASLILSALVVFRAKRIMPRTWLERENANRAVLLNIGITAAFLVVVCVLIVALDLGARIEIGG